jgi:hypothetical protein
VGVHLAGEHAAELEQGDALLEGGGVTLEVGESRRVALGLDEFEQLGRVGDAPGDAVEIVDHVRETRALAAELLGPVGVSQMRGFSSSRFSSSRRSRLRSYSKDTPSARRGAARGLSGIV